MGEAVAADTRAQALLAQETAAAIKETNTNIDAAAQQMKDIANKNREDIKAVNAATIKAITEEQARVAAATENFTQEDKDRQAAADKFLVDQLAIAGKAMEVKFGAAYAKLADNRADADHDLAEGFEQLNDSLAKQAALADSRFSKTVDDLAAARKQAADQVAEFRKDFAAALITTTAHVKNVETKIATEIEKVSGEVISFKADQVRVNKKVEEELLRIQTLSNHRHSMSKKARGKLKKLMDGNKDAAAAEVAALEVHQKKETDKARAHNAHNRIAMAKSLSSATEKFYADLAKQQKAQNDAQDALQGATAGALAASQSALEHSKAQFDSKIIGLTDTVVSNAAAAEREFSRVTGVVNDYASASEHDRDLIKEETKAMEADLNKALTRAVSIGEAKAKAVQQRIAEHLKDPKRYLMVELNDRVEDAADNVLKIMEGKRQSVADNYLSLKAYAVSVVDLIEDYVTKGKGRGPSSIGDLLAVIGSMCAVHAPDHHGLGMGGSELPTIFSGETIPVSGAVGAINGLCDEFTVALNDVHNRWPMGLGKYLMDKLEIAMLDKGVLQVDKVEGKSGNYVFINGRSVGLSNKLSDFSDLAAKMTTYESVLAKLTAKIVPPAPAPAPFYDDGPEWQGD